MVDYEYAINDADQAANILIVDDTPFNLEILSDSLHQAGFVGEITCQR